MSDENLNSINPTDSAISPFSPAAELSQNLSPRMDLTYRKIENLNVKEVDINQSLLTGSLIRGSSFHNTNFSRSDLDGMRVENTIFVECDFTSCDFRSNIFSNCRFKSCLLNSTFIDDCEFQTCEFDNCSFTVGSLTRCRFQKSSLRSCDLRQTTFLHNKFYGSAISDMVFGDCALQYIILRDCDLTKVTLAAESIGALFGLTREQLSSAKIIYLGEEEQIPLDSEVLFLLLEEYQKRNWYVGELVLSVNFGLTSTLSAFDKYFSFAYKRFAEFGFTNGDELEFLGDLFHELAHLERLPLMTLLNTLEWCSKLELAIGGSRETSESSTDSLHTLASRLTFLANNLLDRFEHSLQGFDLNRAEKSLCIKVTFEHEPEIPLPDILNSLTANLNLGHWSQGFHKSRRIRTEAGSFIDIVLTTLLSVIGFQVFLFLINGCVIQLTELKHRVNVLVRKEPPKSYKDIALSPSQQPSPMILSILGGLTEYAKGLGWLKTPSLSGYSPSNIKLLEEVKCENSQIPPSSNV